MSMDNINLPIGKIAAILGILVTLSSFGAWVYQYHSQFVTRSEIGLSTLDDKIAHSELLTTLYELHGLTNLTELERVKYDRANERLVALRRQRDGLLGVPSS